MVGPVSIYSRKILSDQLTPVIAYRKLVAPDERTAASFLLESVEQGGAVGRYSMLGAQPALEVIARENTVRIITRDELGAASERSLTSADPLALVREIQPWEGVELHTEVPEAFHGGWVGYVGFDAVRWLEWEKLPFAEAPHDDRRLPDLHLALYKDAIVFDHVAKTIYLVSGILADAGDSAARDAAGARALDRLEARLLASSPALASGRIDLDISAAPTTPGHSTTGQARFEASVETAREYIAAGDAFQIVLSQRFSRESHVDPFEVYRALRIVNPSPYQVYLQAHGCILAAASPEILCRTRGGTVTNRPLAGTRRRGATPEEDRALEQDLFQDAKEIAEHTMLVDLGRNDLGRVCESGSVHLHEVMGVERYSHVMHLASTITGHLKRSMDSWDALRATLPVGTVSGAPKVRAIQIIDELEPLRRGPYAGGLGAIGWDGDMDMAIALRTIVIPVAQRNEAANPPRWRYDLQAGAGVVLDSDPVKEHAETVAKAAALGRAIDLAERAFG